MIKDLMHLIRNKCKVYAIAPMLQDLIRSEAFKNGLFLLGVLAFARACILLAPQSLRVTSSSAVNGRELPVYCVQTDQKKVALSFDAAWAGGWLR